MLPLLCRLAICLTVAGCGKAAAVELNSKDDLHCAIAARHIERNIDPQVAPDSQTESMFALQTWYFSKVSEDRLAETESVIAIVKRNPKNVAPVALDCAARANANKEFAPFALWAIRDRKRGS